MLEFVLLFEMLMNDIGRIPMSYLKRAHKHLFPGLKLSLVYLSGWSNWKNCRPRTVYGFWRFRSHSTHSRHERFQGHCCRKQRCRCTHIPGDYFDLLPLRNNQGYHFTDFVSFLFKVKQIDLGGHWTKIDKHN